jgi:hypothetical protein
MYNLWTKLFRAGGKWMYVNSGPDVLEKMEEIPNKM